jgi:uncharacterized membrane protein YbhN (UPF0104 family)
LILVARKLDFGVVASTVNRLELVWLLAAWVTYQLSRLAAVWRLNLYYQQVTLKLGFVEATKLFYLGMFYNFCLPGGISGDAYKVYLLHQHHPTPLADLAKATFCDRLSGLFAMIWLSLACAWMSGLLTPWHLDGVCLAVAGLMVPLSFLCNWLFDARFLAITTPTALGALAVQGLQGVSALCLYYAVGIQADMWSWLAIFYLTSVVSVLPISFGGAGTRELTVIYLAPLVGMVPSVGVCGSMLFFLLIAVSSLPGMLFMDTKYLFAPQPSPTVS